MYDNILIPVAIDHEDDVTESIKAARLLLSDGGRITLMSVVEDIPGYVAEYVTISPAKEISQKLAARLDTLSKGYDDVNTIVVFGNAGVSITKHAEEAGVDLIIVKSHRSDLQEYFLGSTSSRVVRRAHCSVLVIR
jgi:nucleotide-binding universal stress UspA family protein